MSFPKMTRLSWIYDLYRVSQANAPDGNAVPVEQRVIEQIINGFEGDTGSLVMLDATGQMIIVAAVGLPEGVVGTRVKSDRGVLGWVIREHSPLLLNGDVSNDPRFTDRPARGSDKMPCSSMCWPLYLSERLIGTLSINRRAEGTPYSQDDLEQGTVIVNLVTLAIENLRLHREQRSRIAALTESEARFLATFDQAAVGMSLQDLDGNLVQANQKICEILGYTSAELRQLSFRQITHPDDLGRNIELRQKLMAGEIDTYSHEKRYLRKDGSPVWVSVSVSLARDAERRPKHTISVMVDISDRKRAEQALQKSHAELKLLNDKLVQSQGQLLQSEKMAAVGQLAAGVAHEINNPIGFVNSNLGTLTGYVERLLVLVDNYERSTVASSAVQSAELQAARKEADLPFLRDDVVALLAESRDGLERVKKIVQDLRDFSRVDSAEWNEADLNAGMESTLNVASNELKYKAEVIKKYGELPPVRCHLGQINQVFMNLLVNAAQAIEERGKITLTSGTEGPWAWVSVEDTGKGMTPEVLKRIFEPFFTTKPVGKGTGLGLSLAYDIVKKHGGRIEVQSKPGRGTRFQVWLPMAGPETPQS